MPRQTWRLFTEKLSDLVMSRFFEDLLVFKINCTNLVRGIPNNPECAKFVSILCNFNLAQY